MGVGVGVGLLLDEHVEHEVMDRLQWLGHDVEHVEFAEEVGKGAPDRSLARFSLARKRVVVTYDDDFVTTIPPNEYHGVLFFEDEELQHRTSPR